MPTLNYLTSQLFSQSILWLDPLLAATHRRVHRRSRSSDGISSETLMILLAIGLAALVGVATFYLIRVRSQAPTNNPRTLLRELCHAHQLNRNQANLIARLAAGLKLAHPGILFLDSGAWRIPEDSSDAKSLTKKDWDKLLAIQRVLFLPAGAKIG